MQEKFVPVQYGSSRSIALLSDPIKTCAGLLQQRPPGLLEKKSGHEHDCTGTACNNNDNNNDAFQLIMS